MEGYGRKKDGCPRLLDLISKESREWIVKRGDHGTNHGEKKLELSLGLGLGPPGGEWTISPSPWPLHLQTQSHHVKPKESSQPCCSMQQQQQQQSAEKKAFSTATATATAATTAVSNSAQKRSAPAPVVGWPPIRSFRKNLASKSSSESPNVDLNKGANEKKAIESCSQKGMFVKINMDCIPIGRKVDLKAYDSYEKLSSAVDELFRGLLAAQRDTSGGGIHNKDDEKKPITGLLDGSGEYTLVYEDNEGDRMLVGDVPWRMFVSTVKRLRVLKSSELPMLRRESKHGKLSHNS